MVFSDSRNEIRLKIKETIKSIIETLPAIKKKSAPKGTPTKDVLTKIRARKLSAIAKNNAGQLENCLALRKMKKEIKRKTPASMEGTKRSGVPLKIKLIKGVVVMSATKPRNVIAM